MDHIASFTSDLMTETNHRVANSLALLGSLVRIQARAVGRAPAGYSNAELRLMFDGIAARIATIAQLHRMLARVPADGTLALNPHLREVCAILISAFSSEQQPVRIRHGGAECFVLARYIQPLSLIVCEILTNAIKYAHPAGAPANMQVGCEAREDGTLILSVSDDGVGLPEGFNASLDGGIGFQIIRALSGEMGAGLQIHSDAMGVTFLLTVPGALVANARTA